MKYCLSSTILNIGWGRVWEALNDFKNNNALRKVNNTLKIGFIIVAVFSFLK